MLKDKGTLDSFKKVLILTQGLTVIQGQQLEPAVTTLHNTHRKTEEEQILKYIYNHLETMIVLTTVHIYG